MENNRTIFFTEFKLIQLKYLILINLRFSIDFIKSFACMISLLIVKFMICRIIILLFYIDYGWKGI